MRIIHTSPTFESRLVRFIKLHKELKQDVFNVMRQLEIDVYDPKLRTHKLHGKMEKAYACSINYHYRIVFTFDDKYVYPKSIGSHEDVY